MTQVPEGRPTHALEPEWTFGMHVRFLDRMQFVPERKPTRDDQSNQNADQKEPAISREHDQQHRHNNDRDDKPRRPLKAESKAPTRFRLHEDYCSAAFKAEIRTPKGCPSIREKALSRRKCPVPCRSTAFFAREVEDQDSGNLTLNHLTVEDRSTNHRYGLYIDHDSSMRTSSRSRSRGGGKVENGFLFSTFAPPTLEARAPNQSSGLACADQGHPRAALDANDLWIRFFGAQHPVESYR